MTYDLRDDYLAAGFGEEETAEFDIPYTFSDPLVLSLPLHKALTKRVLKGTGISTPNYITYNAAKPPAHLGLNFPVIIKPRFEDASIGITQESIVDNEKTLKKKLAELSERFGLLIIEEYIAGREFNLSLFSYPSPRILPIAEINFTNYPDTLYPILDYRAKWDSSSFEYQHTKRTFPRNLSLILARKLEMAGYVCFHTLMLRDYGRVDIRVAENRKLYILEVNANPCLSPDAGFPAAIEASGIPFTRMVAYFIQFLTQRIPSHVNQTRSTGR